MLRAVFVVVCVVTTHAAADPIIAVRLEAKEPESAKTVVALTKALRTTAAKTNKRAKPTPAAVDKAVVAAECSVLQPACAASIGASLDVTHMLVGQVEKRGARYALTASLINVQTKQRVRSLREVMPAKVDARRWARTLFAKLLEDGAGELVIVANARRAQILVDGLPVTELYEGRATISNLALGTHQIELRASGYKPFSIDVSVDGHTEETFLLEPQP